VVSRIMISRDKPDKFISIEIHNVISYNWLPLTVKTRNKDNWVFPSFIGLVCSLWIKESSWFWFVRNFVLRGEESSLRETPVAVTACAFWEREEREKLKMTKRYQRKEEMVFPCQTLKSQVKPKDDLGNCFRKENSKPVGRLLLITVSYKSISCSK
jgi:hypothetical protein